MKNILFFTLAIAMFFVSCKKDSEDKETTSTVAGIVKLNDGSIVSNANIFLILGTDTIQTVVSNTSGSFSFSNIEQGTYVISAFHTQLKNAKPIEVIIESNTDYNLDFIFELFASVQGTLIDVNKVPMEGYTVLIQALNNLKSTSETFESAITNHAGQFSFYSLPSNTYKIQFIDVKGNKAETMLRYTESKEAKVVLNYEYDQFLIGQGGIVYGKVLDSRDGREYKTVKIGNQEWMAENLAYLPQVDYASTPTDADYTTPRYYVYNFNPNSEATEPEQIKKAKESIFYQTRGVLYNWPAAMNGEASSTSNPSNVQGACPDGWHLPSNSEWSELHKFISKDTEIPFSLAIRSKKTISNGGFWYDNYGGTDTYGFNAIASGYKGYWGSFEFQNGYILFHSSSSSSYHNSYTTGVYYYSFYPEINNTYNKRYGSSIRCLKD